MIHTLRSLIYILVGRMLAPTCAIYSPSQNKGQARVNTNPALCISEQDGVGKHYQIKHNQSNLRKSLSEEEKLLFMESYYGRIKWSCSGGGKGIIKLQDRTKWFPIQCNVPQNS